jgi:hypothetical protein
MFLIQHGWGGGSLIDRVVERDLADGVIFGAGDEAFGSLASVVAAHRARRPELIVLVDPQTYVLALPDPNIKKLGTYPYGRALLTARELTARRIPRLVAETLDVQRQASATRLLSPTVPHRAFNDQWSQIAMLLAQESVDRAKDLGIAQDLLISIVMSEDNLLAWQPLNDFLDELTTLDCRGFYLTVARNRTSGADTLEADKLRNLMLALYSLTELNGYEVTVGYAGLLGSMLRTSGAQTTAAGWFRSLRSLSFERWTSTQGGGRRPLPRFTSPTLLNSVVYETDLGEFHRRGLLGAVVGDSPFSDKVLSRAEPWTSDEDRLQYFFSCRALDRMVEGRSLPDRISAMFEAISRAEAVYERMEGLPLQPGSGPRHLGGWRSALSQFSRAIEDASYNLL